MPLSGDKHGAAFIIIANVTGITWSILVFLVRLFLRIKVNGPFGWDDAACAVATTTGISHGVAIFFSVHHGLGYQPPNSTNTTQSPTRRSPLIPDHLPQDENSLFVWMYISNLAYLATIGATMLSISFLISRITKWRLHLIMASCISYVIIFWTLLCAFLLAFELASLGGRYNSQCGNRAGIVADSLTPAMEGSTEHQIQDQGASRFCTASVVRARTALLLTAEWFDSHAKVRTISVLPPSFVRLHFIRNAIDGQNFTADRIDPAILSILTMHLSVALATIPCAKPFFAVFEGGVFRSPQEPKTDTRQSFEMTGGTGESAEVDGGSHKEPSEPPERPVLTWNRRASFAQPVKHTTTSTSEMANRVPPLPPRSILSFTFMNPFAWSCGRRSRKTVSITTPLPQWRTTERAESSSSSPFSHLSHLSRFSHLSAFTKGSLGRNSSSTRQGPGSSHGDSQQCETPTSNGSYLRRESDYFSKYRPNDGKSSTFIRHDPEHAEEVAKKKPFERGDQHEVRRGGIELTHSFEVSYEDAVPPSSPLEVPDDEATPRPLPEQPGVPPRPTPSRATALRATPSLVTLPH